MGGPVLPSQGPGAADGELVFANSLGGAFVTFYIDRRKAQRLERAAVRRAKRLGWQVERRGAVSIAWIRAPGITLRSRVRACVFV